MARGAESRVLDNIMKTMDKSRRLSEVVRSMNEARQLKKSIVQHAQQSEALQPCCENCAKLKLPDRVENWNEETDEPLLCGCEPIFERTRYCARHATAKGVCRRCGCSLPTRKRKDKSTSPKLGAPKKEQFDKNGIRIL